MEEDWYFEKAKERARDFMEVAMQRATAKANELKEVLENDINQKAVMFAEEMGCDQKTAVYFLRYATHHGDMNANYLLARRMYKEPELWNLTLPKKD